MNAHAGAKDGSDLPFRTVLRVGWGVYCLLSSLYCLLASLPYTYYALIKAPVYEWMPWFARHHAELYWVALLAAVIGFSIRITQKGSAILLTALAGVGVFLTFHPVLLNLQSPSSSFLFSLIALVVLLLPVIHELFVIPSTCDDSQEQCFSYTLPVFASVIIACCGIWGAELQVFIESGSGKLHWPEPLLWFWSLTTHVALAFLAISLVNIIIVLTAGIRRRRAVRRLIVLGSAYAVLFFPTAGFLNHALGAPVWYANLYAAVLTMSVLGFFRSVLLPVMTFAKQSASKWSIALRHIIVGGAAFSLAGMAIVLPSLVGAWDWNGLIQRVFVVVFWTAFAGGTCILYGKRQRYSAPALLGIVLLTLSIYGGLFLTKIYWAKGLGATDDEIARSFETYSSNDPSFQLAHVLLSEGAKQEECGDLCRILRQYTNVRDAKVVRDVRLVENITLPRGALPNIFVVIVDSMRPDYLGVYNPSADFSPNIDSFARDSVVFRNAYTQYAGTTLSEPAIWSGALLLHAHYMRPFEKANGLEKLVRAGNYRMIVSYDSVLQQLLAPDDDLIKLDTDKKLWTQFELCSTVDEFSRALDGVRDSSRPVFFYAQPMNVHQFAHNNLPTWKDTDWRRPGFNTATSLAVHQVDACLGSFFSALKARNLYDNSIIVLAADHGDGASELGRRGHSMKIYPEIMKVPLIMHLPKSLQHGLFVDTNRIATLTDIVPSLYYLLGNEDLATDAVFGRSLFAHSPEELAALPQKDIFLASDERAVYGILAGQGRFLYTTYDAPARSYLFDLSADPKAEKNILTPELKQQFDREIIDNLKMIADFYGYRPGMHSLLAGR